MVWLRRWLVVGVAVLVLGTAYQVLVVAFQILALPRFEIPYVEPAAGLCGFGHYDPDEWLVLTLVALGLSWAPLAWAKARRVLVTRWLAGLAVLAAAVGLTWLTLVAGGTRAILHALRAWRLGGSLIHPGFEYLSYEGLLDAAQIGLGHVALALVLLSWCARLQQQRRFRTEAVAAARAGLLLVVGAALSVRSAWLNEAGCFPLWPAFRRDAPESWDGLWTTSVGFYGGCLLLAFVAWPAARRRAWLVVPLALSAVYAYQHGRWGPQCSCQAVDVPSVPVATVATTAYPAAQDWAFAPSEAVQLSRRGVRWRGEHFESVPAFFDAFARSLRERRLVSATVFGDPVQPLGNLVLRLAPDTPLQRLRDAVAGARPAGFSGIAFELGIEPWHIDLAWGIEVPEVRLLRASVPFADECGWPLDFGLEQSGDAWLTRFMANLGQHRYCFTPAAVQSRSP